MTVWNLKVHEHSQADPTQFAFWPSPRLVCEPGGMTTLPLASFAL